LQPYETAGHADSASSLREPELRRRSGDNTQEALEDLRSRLDALISAVERLERQNQERQAFWRRELGDAAIIAAVLMLSGLFGLKLLGQFF